MFTKRWLHILLILAAVWIPYGLSMGNERIGDDHALLELRLDPGRIVDFGDLWQENYWGYLDDCGLYRPLALSTLYAERLIFGLTEWPYRVVNLLLYGLCGVLSYLFLSRVAGQTAALAGALLFVLHPVHAEVVLAAYGQAEMLATAFVFLALLAHVRSVREGSLFWAGTAALCFFAAMLSKESAVAFLALAILTRGFFLNPTEAGWRRWVAPSDVLYAAAAAGYGAIKFAVIGSIGTPEKAIALAGLSYTRKLYIIATNGLGNYLRLTLLPWSQSMVYDMFPSTATDVAWVIAGAVVLVLSARILGLRAALFAGAWFGSTWFIFSNLIVPTGVFVAERCLFLPVFAVCFLFGLFVERASGAAPAKKAVLFSAGLILSLAAAQSAHTAWDWRTEQSSLRASVRERPFSPTARSLLAVRLVQQASPTPETITESETLAQSVLQQFPGVPDAHRAMGLAAKARGNYSLAINHLRRALEARPRDKLVQEDLAVCERLAAGNP